MNIGSFHVNPQVLGGAGVVVVIGLVYWAMAKGNLRRSSSEPRIREVLRLAQEAGIKPREIYFTDGESPARLVRDMSPEERTEHPAGWMVHMLSNGRTKVASVAEERPLEKLEKFTWNGVR